MPDVIKKPTVDILELFDNPYPNRDYLITHVCPEFTSLCPKTGQPDYGTITIEYVADKTCVELKSLKFYLQGYRNEGVFYERLTNQILDDLVTAMAPRYLKLTAAFTPRGGLHSTIVATHVADGWSPSGGSCGGHGHGHGHGRGHGRCSHD